MALSIDASELEVGDLFYEPHSRFLRLRRVTGIRVLRTVETYSVIDYETVVVSQDNAPGFGRGQLNLRADIEVTRVEPVDTEALMATLKAMSTGNGGHIIIWWAQDADDPTTGRYYQ